jgi:hypothetical protein
VIAVTWLSNTETEQAEHECPRPMAERVDEFTVGGMVFAPSGRWERVLAIDPHDPVSMTRTVRTDRAVWTLRPSTSLPYLPAWEAGRASVVAVLETDSTLTVEVAREGYGPGQGHQLVSAIRSRGAGWLIWDRPDGATSEQVSVSSRAKARTEVRRRAKAHAKRLGLSLAPNDGGER